MEVSPLDRAWSRSRTSMGTRVERLRSKAFVIVQCALAAGVAWLIAKDLLGHQTPFFAPIAAVMADHASDCVEVTVRAVKVEALKECSA